MAYFGKICFVKSALTTVRSRLFYTGNPLKSLVSSKVGQNYQPIDKNLYGKYIRLIDASFMRSLNKDAVTKEQIYAELWEKMRQDFAQSPALLRFFLESKYKAGCDMNFPATLECFKKSNISVNDSIISTYVGFACNEGDMDLAKHYLDELKLLGFVPNRVTFSKVLQGYIRNKSSEQVNATIQLMKSLNYWPSSIGYHNALVAYADNGDSQSFIKTFEEYEEFLQENDGIKNEIIPPKLFDYYSHLVKSSSGLEAKQLILSKISEINKRKLVYSIKSAAVISELLFLNHLKEAKQLLHAMNKVGDVSRYFLDNIITNTQSVPVLKNVLEASDLSPDAQFYLINKSKLSDVAEIYNAMSFRSLSIHQRILRMIHDRIVENKNVDVLKDILASEKLIFSSYFLASKTLLRLGYDPKDAVNLFGETEKVKECIAYGMILNTLMDSTHEDLKLLVDHFKQNKFLPYNQSGSANPSSIVISLFGTKEKLANLNVEKENISKKLDHVLSCVNDRSRYKLAAGLLNYCVRRHESIANEPDRLVQEADVLIDVFIKNKIRFYDADSWKTLSSCGIEQKKLNAINIVAQSNKNLLIGNHLKELIKKSDYAALHGFLRKKSNFDQRFPILHTLKNDDKKYVPLDITAYMLKEMKAGAIEDDNKALYETFAYRLDTDYLEPSVQVISSLLEKFISDNEKDLVTMVVEKVLDIESVSPLLFTPKILESVINYDAETIWPILMMHLNAQNNSLRQFVLKSTAVYSSFQKPPVDNKVGIVSWPSYLLTDYLDKNHMASVKKISDEMMHLVKSRRLLEAYYLRSWAADISVKMKVDTNLMLNSSYSFCPPISQNITRKLIKEAFVPDGKISPLLLDVLEKSSDVSSSISACNEIGRTIVAQWDSILSQDVFSTSKSPSYLMTPVDKLHFITNILNCSESRIKLTSINLTTIVHSIMDNVSNMAQGIQIVESLIHAYHFNKYTLVNSVLLGALKFNDPTLQIWLNDFIHKNSVNNDLRSAIISLAVSFSNEKMSELCWNYETAEKAVGSLLSKEEFSVVFNVFNGEIGADLDKNILDLCCDIAVHSPEQFSRLLHGFKTDHEKLDYVLNRVFDSLRCLRTPFGHRSKFVDLYTRKVSDATLTNDNKAYIIAMQRTKGISPLSRNNVDFMNEYFSNASKVLENQTLAAELNSLMRDDNFRKVDIIANLKNLLVDDLIKISTPLIFLITAKHGMSCLNSLLYECADMHLSNILGELSDKAASVTKNFHGESFYCLSKRMKNIPLNEMESQLIRFHFLRRFVPLPKSKKTIDLSASVLKIMKNSVPDIAKKISEGSLQDEDLKNLAANFAAMNGLGKTSLLLAWLTDFRDVKRVKFMLEHMPAQIAETRSPYVNFSECLSAVNNSDAASIYDNSVKELLKKPPQNISSCLVGPHVSRLLRHWPDGSIPSLLHLSNHFAISTHNIKFLMRVFANLVGRGLIDGKENKLNSASCMDNTSTFGHFESLLSFIQLQTSSSNPLIVPITYLAGSSKYPLSSDEWNNVVAYVRQRDTDQLPSLIDMCLRNAALNAKMNNSLAVLIDALQNLSFNEITNVYDLAIICQSSTLREIWMVTQLKKDELPAKVDYLLTDALMKRGLLAKTHT